MNSRPMSNIDKQALRGQSVEARFYLAECCNCSQIMPSSKLIESRNFPDGDSDCYCPHCNADDCDIADLGDAGVTACNYQQKRIEALLDELEAADKYAKDRDAENKDLMLTVGRLRVEKEAAEKRITELSVSHNNLREAMAGIHNTITGGGAYTPLAAILNASKRAYEESAAASSPKGE